MYTRRINVRGIIFKDGKLFVQRLKKNGVEYDYWCTPGGGLDDGEDLLAGLKREMIEETGVTPVIGKLLFIQQFHDGEKEQLEFFFHIENADDYETLDLDATSHGHLEVAEHAFVDPKTNHILPQDIQEIDITGYISGSLPPLIMSHV